LDLVVHGKTAQASWWHVFFSNFFQDVVGMVALVHCVPDFNKHRAKTIAVKLTLLSILYAARSGLEHPGVNTIEESWPEADLQTSKRSEERELSASN